MPGRPCPRYLTAYLQNRRAIEAAARLAASIAAGAALYALARTF